jgi:hypothetical protein
MADRSANEPIEAILARVIAEQRLELERCFDETERVRDLHATQRQLCLEQCKRADKAESERDEAYHSLRAVCARIDQWSAADSDAHSESRRLADALSALFHLATMLGRTATPATTVTTTAAQGGSDGQ